MQCKMCKCRFANNIAENCVLIAAVAVFYVYIFRWISRWTRWAWWHAWSKSRAYKGFDLWKEFCAFDVNSLCTIFGCCNALDKGLNQGITPGLESRLCACCFSCWDQTFSGDRIRITHEFTRKNPPP